MKNNRLSAFGLSFEKNERGYLKPFLFCRRGNGDIRCLPATRESSSQETRLYMGRKISCTFEIYIAEYEGTTYEYEYLSATQLLPLEISEQERVTHAAWLAIEVERAEREDREREAAFQKFLYSDQLETWLRGQPRCDDNKFLHGSPRTQREHLQWCYSLHGSPGIAAWEYLREDRAAAILERLKDIAARIRAEEKAKYVKA